MTSRSIEKTLEIHVSLMEEIKLRTNFLQEVASRRLNIPTMPAFELCQIQIRKICELVSLACLVAHGDLSSIKDSILQKEYNAEKIIKKLSLLHPNFFPRPHVQEVKAVGRFHLSPKADIYLTKEDLIKSYNDSGAYLHRGSIKRILTKWQPDIDFNKILDWSTNLMRLLESHSLVLYGDKGMILCLMNANGKVQSVYAEAMN